MSSQEQKDGLYQERHGKKTDGSSIADMNFFLSNVVFPNVDGRFRFTSSVSSDGIDFILEKMSLSNRWSVHVKDLSKHGQAGLSKQIVFSILKNSLEAQVINKTGEYHEADLTSPVVEIESKEDGKVVLHLDIPLCGDIGASLTYAFEMIPVARDAVDKLTSMLHDANDEINELKEGNVAMQRLLSTAMAEAVVGECEAKPVSLISLRSTAAAYNGGAVAWNLLERNTNTDLFEVSTDNTTITVVKPGLYQTYVRLANNDSSGARYTSIYVNGVEHARSQCGQNTGYYNSTNMSDILCLAASSTVTVRHYGNQNTYAHAASSHFYMIKL